MRRLPVLPALALAALILSPPDSRAEVVFAGAGTLPVAAALPQRADYLGHVVTLTPADPSRLPALAAARKALLERLGKNRQLTLVEDQGWAGSGEAGPLAVRVAVLLRLTAEDQVSLEVAQELESAGCGEEGKGEGVSCGVSEPLLAVETPEQYRPRILERIRDHARLALVQLSGGGGRVEVAGLEGPVRVRRAGDLTVELYLDYRLAAGVP